MHVRRAIWTMSKRHMELIRTGEEAQAQPEKLCGQRSLGVLGGPGSLKREGKPDCCPGDVQGDR